MLAHDLENEVKKCQTKTAGIVYYVLSADRVVMEVFYCMMQILLINAA
jgi:hypothetical protein